MTTSRRYNSRLTHPPTFWYQMRANVPLPPLSTLHEPLRSRDPSCHHPFTRPSRAGRGPAEAGAQGSRASRRRAAAWPLPPLHRTAWTRPPPGSAARPPASVSLGVSPPFLSGKPPRFLNRHLRTLSIHTAPTLPPHSWPPAHAPIHPHGSQHPTPRVGNRIRSG